VFVAAGVVDQDVDGTAGQRRGGHGVRAGVGRQVADRHLGAAALGADRRRHRVRPALVAAVHHDLDALLGEQRRGRLAQPHTGTGDQRALPEQPQVHL
jgi:hypothetical protein